MAGLDRQAIIRQVSASPDCPGAIPDAKGSERSALQVEHYLGLSNLATDKFLRSHMAASASGVSVPLSVLASFPLLRALCNEASGTDPSQSREELIAAVLKDSQASCPPCVCNDACAMMSLPRSTSAGARTQPKCALLHLKLDFLSRA